MNQNIIKDSLTQILIQLVASKEPRSVQQLVHLAKGETSIPELKIIEHILRLRS